MSKTLNVVCNMNNGTKKNYSINDPKSNLTKSQIDAAFDVAIQKDFFNVDGAKPDSVISTYYEEVIRTDITE